MKLEANAKINAEAVERCDKLILRCDREEIDSFELMRKADKIEFYPSSGRLTTYNLTRGLAIIASLRDARTNNSIRTLTQLAGLAGKSAAQLKSWLEYGSRDDADPRVRAFAVSFAHEIAQTKVDFLDNTLKDALPRERLRALEGAFPLEHFPNRVVKAPTTNIQLNVSNLLQRAIESNPEVFGDDQKVVDLPLT